MNFYPHRSLRLAALAALATVLVISILLAVPAVSGAATSCKSPKQVWIVNGKAKCLKTAKLSTDRAALTPKGRVQTWFAAVNKPAGKNRLKVPAKLLRAQRKAAGVAAKALDRVPVKSARTTLARAALSGSIVETISVDGPSMTTGGVKLSSHIDGKAYADGTTDLSLTVAMEVEGYTIKYQPQLKTTSSVIPEVDCPDADGLLKIDYVDSMGGTMTAFKGRKLLGAVTEKFTNTLKARGHVGRDARLHDVDASVSSKIEHYERGTQMVITSSGNFKITREGTPVRDGDLSAKVSLKVAGATRAQEAAAEQLLAQQLASDEQSSGLGSSAETARWRMLQDEYKWYSIPNGCANILYSPDSTAKLGEGATTQVEGWVRAQDGREAHGEFSVTAVSKGQFKTTRPQSDPGAHALFAAKGADKADADHLTVGSDVIATSTAGRAQWGWYARADELDLPKSFIGPMGSESAGTGDHNSFSGIVEYTLGEVYVSPEGYVSAFYHLSRANLLSMLNEIGVGCRYVATGSGGNVVDGDIELRRPPGGHYTYAVMLDVEIPDTNFVATDCGPNPPPPFRGNLVSFVNQHMLGGGFLEVPDDFKLEVDGLTHSDATTQRTTSASWQLLPQM
jgi:hypothetical protein